MEYRLALVRRIQTSVVLAKASGDNICDALAQALHAQYEHEDAVAHEALFQQVSFEM